MFKPGDCVKGVFPVPGETLLDHHSVVVAIDSSVKEAVAMLVYTTSIKPGEESTRHVLSRAFTDEERKMAKWPNPCRYDATRVALVPVSKLTSIEGARVPSRTLKEITDSVMQASQRGRLQRLPYNPAHPVRMTGHVSMLKREEAHR